MKQKSGGIKRLMEFTGKHRGLLTVSRILSGISSVFILGPFLCVYFAARDLVGVFAGTPLDTNSLVRWGLLALELELIGLVLYFSALLSCCGVPYREKPEDGGTKTFSKNAYGIF